MPDIGFSTSLSYYLNRFDVFGCVLVISRLSYLFYHKYGTNFYVLNEHRKLCLLVASLFILLRVSEYDKYNARLKKMYIVTH